MKGLLWGLYGSIWIVFFFVAPANSVLAMVAPIVSVSATIVSVIYGFYDE